MKKQYDIIKIATHNLDLAIRLFIKEHEGAAAILLASAAEESFNDELVKQGKTTILSIAKQNASEIYGISTKAVNDNHANSVRNWLKHANSTTLVYDEDEEAFQYIMRAIISYEMIFKKFEKSHYDFVEHVKNEMPRIASIFDHKIAIKMKHREQIDGANKAEIVKP